MRHSSALAGAMVSLVLLASCGGGDPSGPPSQDPQDDFDFSGRWLNHIQLLDCESGEVMSESSSEAIVCPGSVPGESDSCDVVVDGAEVETVCEIREYFGGLDCALVTGFSVHSSFDDSSYTGMGQGVLRLDGSECGSPDSTVINCFDVVVWGSKVADAPDSCQSSLSFPLSLWTLLTSSGWADEVRSELQFESLSLIR